MLRASALSVYGSLVWIRMVLIDSTRALFNRSATPFCSGFGQLSFT